MAFAGGLYHPSGGDWIVGATERRRNPRLTLPAVYNHVVRLWARCRGGMGAGLLPEAGGVNDQPNWLMKAFALLDGADAELEKTGKDA
ncbi:hypothetical protein VQH23_16270 [Pararoseomonas sp. SCSIO 73927]|uniref:hypothetical protein n=1 Tax=Pararoseomonas sp. SCSIO 73927 TaxID=3114537 RepID=UPI0030CFF699